MNSSLAVDNVTFNAPKLPFDLHPDPMKTLTSMMYMARLFSRGLGTAASLPKGVYATTDRWGNTTYVTGVNAKDRQRQLAESERKKTIALLNTEEARPYMMALTQPTIPAPTEEDPNRRVPYNYNDLDIGRKEQHVREWERNVLPSLAKNFNLDQKLLQEMIVKPWQEANREERKSVEESGGFLTGLAQGAQGAMDFLTTTAKGLFSSPEERLAMTQQAEAERQDRVQKNPALLDLERQNQLGDSAWDSLNMTSFGEMVGQHGPTLLATMALPMGAGLGAARLGLSAAAAAGARMAGAVVPAAAMGSQMFMEEVANDPNLTDEQKVQAYQDSKVGATVIGGVTGIPMALGGIARSVGQKLRIDAARAAVDRLAGEGASAAAEQTAAETARRKAVEAVSNVAARSMSQALARTATPGALRTGLESAAEGALMMGANKMGMNALVDINTPLEREWTEGVGSAAVTGGLVGGALGAGGRLAQRGAKWATRDRAKEAQKTTEETSSTNDDSVSVQDLFENFEYDPETNTYKQKVAPTAAGKPVPETAGEKAPASAADEPAPMSEPDRLFKKYSTPEEASKATPEIREADIVNWMVHDPTFENVSDKDLLSKKKKGGLDRDMAERISNYKVETQSDIISQDTNLPFGDVLNKATAEHKNKSSHPIRDAYKHTPYTLAVLRRLALRGDEAAMKNGTEIRPIEELEKSYSPDDVLKLGKGYIESDSRLVTTDLDVLLEGIDNGGKLTPEQVAEVYKKYPFINKEWLDQTYKDDTTYTSNKDVFDAGFALHQQYMTTELMNGKKTDGSPRIPETAAVAESRRQRERNAAGTGTGTTGEPSGNTEGAAAEPPTGNTETSGAPDADAQGAGSGGEQKPKPGKNQGHDEGASETETGTTDESNGGPDSGEPTDPSAQSVAGSGGATGTSAQRSDQQPVPPRPGEESKDGSRVVELNSEDRAIYNLIEKLMTDPELSPAQEVFKNRWRSKLERVFGITDARTETDFATLLEQNLKEYRLCL